MTDSTPYPFTDREEILNALTHGVGLILSVLASWQMFVLASANGTTRHVVSCAVYGACLILVYLASTLYHTAKDPRRKKQFLVLDYVCIYLAIAGTYTPFTVALLGGAWGWTLFGLVWGMAAIGVTTRLLAPRRLKGLSNLTYIAMGWVILVAAYPIMTQFPTGCIAWLVAGGVAYTVGVLFQIRPREYMHTAWHLFVLLGSACHYVAVVKYVLA